MLEACHQVIGVFADRDAVGNHTVEVQRACRRLGLRSEIYALRVDEGSDHAVEPLAALPPDDGRTALLYQASASSPAADIVQARPEPVIVNYHNVTPATFFEVWESTVAQELLHARHQLIRLARRARCGIADSAFNGRELTAMGCADVHVVPVLIDLERLHSSPPVDVGPTGAGSRWLFVGRLCPNKAQHDIVRAFATYRWLFDPEATLALVGRSSSHAYETALRRLIERLRLTDAVQLVGSVPDAELGSWYRWADVFVCLSDHEGFCNTVIEAMAVGTPVIAFGSSAIPETVAAGGLLLTDKDPVVVATTVHRVVTDGPTGAALVAAGIRRARELDLAAARLRLTDVLGRLVAA